MTNEQCQNRGYVGIKSMNSLTQKGSPTLIAYMYLQGGYKVQNRTKSITSVKKKQVLRFRITIAVKCYQPKTTRKVGNLKISSFY